MKRNDSLSSTLRSISSARITEVGDSHGRDGQGEIAAVFLEGQIAGFGNRNLSANAIAARQPFIDIRERHVSGVFEFQCSGKVIEISWDAP